MNCEKARELIALYVGNDLPEDETAALKEHLASCEKCHREYEKMFETYKLITEVSNADEPDILGDAFSDELVMTIGKTEPKIKTVKRRYRMLKYIAAAAVIVLAVIGGSIWYSLYRMDQQFDRNFEVVMNSIMAPAKVVGFFEKFNENNCFTQPKKFEEDILPDTAGVFAIFKKVGEEDGTTKLEVLYCGQSNNISSILSYTWIRSRERQMVNEAGSKENIFISYCAMPESTRGERLKKENDIIEQYKPLFNKKRGA